MQLLNSGESVTISIEDLKLPNGIKLNFGIAVYKITTITES